MGDYASRLDRGLDKLLLDREDPTALGLLRILLVGVLTASLLTHVGSVADYFSDDAVLAGSVARDAFPSRFSLFFWIRDPWAVRAIFAVGVLAHLAWWAGAYTRLSSIIAWLVWVSMFGRHPLLYSLADQLQMALCTLMMLVPGGRGLSVDARYRGRGGSVPVWCRRIIQLQMAVVYTSTGLAKDGATWREEGTALYYALSNPYNRHFDIAPTLAALQPWVLRPATYAVVLWEIGFGPFVGLHWLRGILGRPRWLPDLRWLFLGFGFLMHVGIQSMLYVAWFSPISIASYAAFLRPDEVLGIANRLRRLRRGRATEPDAIASNAETREA